jgi:hypothetical protein
MRTFQSMLHTLFLVVTIGSLPSASPAQDNARLPEELNQNSSLIEVLNWLDQTSFANARVGLNTGETGGNDESGPFHQDAMPAEKPIFSQGFRLANLEGCMLTLRNDDMRILRRPNKLYQWNIGESYVAELYIPLYRLSPRKGRSTYRHTRDPEKARLFGTWRTEFKHRGFFARHDVGISYFPAGQRESKSKGYKDGETLTFTFDSKEMSEKFNAAFRQTIRLCQAK